MISRRLPSWDQLSDDTPGMVFETRQSLSKYLRSWVRDTGCILLAGQVTNDAALHTERDFLTHTGENNRLD